MKRNSGIATTDIIALGFNPMSPMSRTSLIWNETQQWHRHDRYYSIGFQPNVTDVTHVVDM